MRLRAGLQSVPYISETPGVPVGDIVVVVDGTPSRQMANGAIATRFSTRQPTLRGGRAGRASRPCHSASVPSGNGKSLYVSGLFDLQHMREGPGRPCHSSPCRPFHGSVVPQFTREFFAF